MGGLTSRLPKVKYFLASYLYSRYRDLKPFLLILMPLIKPGLLAYRLVFHSTLTKHFHSLLPVHRPQFLTSLAPCSRKLSLTCRARWWSLVKNKKDNNVETYFELSFQPWFVETGKSSSSIGWLKLGSSKSVLSPILILSTPWVIFIIGGF